MNLSGLPGRAAYAILAGVVTFVVLLIIGIIIASFYPEIGEVIKKFAAVIGLLVGLVTFFVAPARPIV